MYQEQVYIGVHSQFSTAVVEVVADMPALEGPGEEHNMAPQEGTEVERRTVEEPGLGVEQPDTRHKVAVAAAHTKEERAVWAEVEERGCLRLFLGRAQRKPLARNP